MSRTSRATSSTGIYHIMMRGINRQSIFRDDADKIKFLSFVEAILNRKATFAGETMGEYEIYAYALMGNHFHILIKVVSGELGPFVKSLASSYAMYFNQKYRRDGHLFKERFKSEPCETDDYFEVLLRYIHQNPLKAGFASDLLQYRYTSWQEYAAPHRAPFKICNTEFVLSQYALDELVTAVHDILPENAGCLDMDQPAGKISDRAVAKFIAEQLGVSGGVEQFKAMDKKERIANCRKLLDYGAGLCQIERLTGVSKATLSRLARK